MDVSDLSRQQIQDGNYEDQDPGQYLDTAFRKADANFAQLYTFVADLAGSLNPDSTGWRYFTGGGINYRVGADIDGIFKIQQALTALGFAGTESIDDGNTGDYITLIPYKFGQ